ncbi:PE-PPE domain-containing protein [Mycolicibacterium sp. CBMA 226]|uniref:PE-PPE domain-containing protein n=1 Tax=Mycolicibacterium sp. CBMA 226 TaxID=2606611 RepID=UPI0012DEE5F2|nr:PE-PPE domain-containing protein [Mycolicibacterium sp. CBMA 226]MUL79841.1 PE-PPE domain-containing protein [Mycolicibacterium sp. CBMA 226]
MSVQMWPPATPAVRGVPRVFLLFTMCCALLVGPATNVTAGLIVGLIHTSLGTVIGIGGRGDPTSANIPAKLNRTVVPPGYTYDPINYPASFQLSSSTAISGPKTYGEILTQQKPIIVAGYSEGTLGAEFAKRQLLANGTGPTPSQLSFLMIASPFAPNGGIFERFPGMSVPFIVDNMGPATPSAYNSTFITNEYDPYADFPAYFNPLSLANSLLGVMYAHPDAYYDSYIPGTTPAIVTSVTNSAGGQDTYVFIKNPDLPLLTPLRIGAGAIGLAPLATPLLDAVEPLLRVLVDMGYTDRQNLSPEQKTPFSMFTPLPKIIEALTAIPGALQQGATNFVTDLQSELHLPPLAATSAVSPLDASTKKTAALAPVAATTDDKPAVNTKADEKAGTKTDVKTDAKTEQLPVSLSNTDKKPAGSGEPDVKSANSQADPDSPPVKAATPKADPDAPPAKDTKPKKTKNAPDADADGPKPPTASSGNDAKDDLKTGPKAGPKDGSKAGAPSEKSAA